MLRFLNQQPLAKVGTALGLSEDAARMCVNRALDRLREMLIQRGVTSTATALAIALGEQGVVAAPAGLAATISTGALAAVSTTATSIQTILQILASTKLKTGIVAIITASAATSIALLSLNNRKLRAEATDLNRQLSGMQQLVEETARLRAGNAGAEGRKDEAAEVARLRSSQEELLRLRGQVAELRRQLLTAASPARQPPETPPVLWRMGERRAPGELRSSGQATPQAALETLLWTAQNQPQSFGDMFRLDPALSDRNRERWQAMAPAAAAALAAQLGKAAKVWVDDARVVDIQSEGESSEPLTVLDLKLEPLPGTLLSRTNLSMAFSNLGTDWVPVMLKDMRAIEPPGSGPDVQYNP